MQIYRVTMKTEGFYVTGAAQNADEAIKLARALYAETYKPKRFSHEPLIDKVERISRCDFVSKASR